MPSRNNNLSGEEQAVVYPDGSALLRPLDPPRSLKAKMLVPVVAACLIGGAIFLGYANAVIGEPQRQQEALEANITRDVALDLPAIAPLLSMGDQDIMSSLQSSGYTMYEKTPLGSNEKGGFEVIKLPSDVSLEQAGLMYLQGID
ncbi:MAG: teichoic acid transporter, partial [Eggerthellaceae bacterium]|nr:teichoic acid transporter [Eggerthellaceae bacterium]